MNRILATFMFFTRLPLWRIANVPAEHFKHVVPLWPLVGWLTGGLMAAVYMLAVHVFSPTVAVVMALLSRVMLTGALHEDGFADFCDGFGGGTTRQRTLEIMKDSHIGTYGVLGLVLYFLFMTALLVNLEECGANLSCGTVPVVAMAMTVADTFCKWTSSAIIYSLPYARTAEQAKNRLVYASVSWTEKVLSVCIALLPMLLFGAYFVWLLPACADIFTCYCMGTLSACTAAIVVSQLLFVYMRSRIGGYTGDCCGATFIITELVFHITLVATLCIMAK